MYKRIIIIVLLSMGLIFSSCSTLHTIFHKKEAVVLPESTDNRMTYEEAIKEHVARQSAETLYVMEVNKKKSAVNTPLRKKKHFFLKRRKSSCSDFRDNVMNIDGVRDVR